MMLQCSPHPIFIQYLSVGHLQEVKMERKLQFFSSKSGHSRLREVVTIRASIVVGSSEIKVAAFLADIPEHLMRKYFMYKCH